MLLIKCPKCHSNSVDEIDRNGKIAFQCFNCGTIANKALCLDSQHKVSINEKNELRHYTVGLIVENEEGKILIGQRRTYPYKWTIFLGHERNGEDAKQTAYRELMEETSLSPKKIKFLFRESTNFPCRYGINWHDITFFKAHVSNKDALVHNNEYREVIWADRNFINQKKNIWSPTAKFVFKRLEIL